MIDKTLIRHAKQNFTIKRDLLFQFVGNEGNQDQLLYMLHDNKKEWIVQRYKEVKKISLVDIVNKKYSKEVNICQCFKELIGSWWSWLSKRFKIHFRMIGMYDLCTIIKRLNIKQLSHAYIEKIY
jgi:hypothetical protein